jgi:hypothetical protein
MVLLHIFVAKLIHFIPFTKKEKYEEAFTFNFTSQCVYNLR